MITLNYLEMDPARSPVSEYWVQTLDLYPNFLFLCRAEPEPQLQAVPNLIDKSQDHCNEHKGDFLLLSS